MEKNNNFSEFCRSEDVSEIDYCTENLMDVSHCGLIDTHCHLDFIFTRLKNSQYANVQSFYEFWRKFHLEFPKRAFLGCIAVFCQPLTWMEMGYEKTFLNENSHYVWGTYGVHPHYADTFTAEVFYALEEILKRDKVVAVGEIGLDYSSKNNVNRKTQKRVFEVLLKMAIDHKLPICLHIRDADEDGLKILKKVNLPKNHPIHLHCFTGKWETCQQWIEAYPELKVGFTPIISKINLTFLHDVVKKLPLDKILLETDAPYFLPRQAPMSQCGFSHPGFVIHTAAQVAKFKGISIESVIQATTENAVKVYNLQLKK